jgi:hypothetical protein
MDEAVVVSCVAYAASFWFNRKHHRTSLRFLRPIGIETSWSIAPPWSGGAIGPGPSCLRFARVVHVVKGRLNFDCAFLRGAIKIHQGWL